MDEIELIKNTEKLNESQQLKQLEVSTRLQNETVRNLFVEKIG